MFIYISHNSIYVILPDYGKALQDPPIMLFCHMPKVFLLSE